jgi:hypothetical protein
MRISSNEHHAAACFFGTIYPIRGSRIATENPTRIFGIHNP